MNPYCERLGIAVPRVEDVLAGMKKKPNLFHLLIAVLVEHGGPMTLEDAAARLLAAGFVPATGDMLLSLQRAWRGREPVFRDPDGRLRLDLGSQELDLILFMAGMRGPRIVVPKAEPEPPPVPAGDDVPLTEHELTIAFTNHSFPYGTAQRQAAAVLDVHQRPMTLAEIEAVVVALTRHRSPLNEESTRWWHTGLVRRREDGTYLLDPSSPHLVSMRRAVRKLVVNRHAQWVEGQRQAEAMAAGDILRAQARRQAIARAAALRRAVLWAIPGALTVLDVRARTLRTLVGDELAGAGDLLAPYDVLVGPQVRDELFALGLEVERWSRLVDLRPPQKKIRIDEQGRTLTVTTELLMRSTLRERKPLNDPAVLARHLAKGERSKLTERLEADAKALFAYYQYGVLHGRVNFGWRGLQTELPVDWAERGDLRIYDHLAHAQATGEPVEVVLDLPPSWDDPWARAQLAWVEGVEMWDVRLRIDDLIWHRDQMSIQAIRPAHREPSLH